MKSDYIRRKEAARAEAIDWQTKFADSNMSYQDLQYWQNHFENLAKRYGLTQEFKENCII